MSESYCNYWLIEGQDINTYKKGETQGELEDEVNNQQREKLDPRCITATASHSGQRVCKCLVGAACRLVRAARLELLVTWPEPLHLTQSCDTQGSLVRAARCWVRAARSELRGQSYSVIPTQSELLGHQGQYAARSELLSAIDLKPPIYSWVIQTMKTGGADLLTPKTKGVADQVSGLS